MVDESRTTGDEQGRVPPPHPPDDPEAWSAADVQAQYEVAPDVVVTIERHGEEFTCAVCEPVLTRHDEAALAGVDVSVTTDSAPNRHHG